MLVLDPDVYRYRYMYIIAAVVETLSCQTCLVQLNIIEDTRTYTPRYKALQADTYDSNNDNKLRYRFQGLAPGKM